LNFMSGEDWELQWSWRVGFRYSIFYVSFFYFFYFYV
jgi:hypothetical protein